MKANVPVDQGIHDLIQCLSDFPGLQTIESCQGTVARAAWVLFVYGEYWDDPYKALADFVLGYLGPTLAQAVGDRATLSVRVNSEGRPVGELCVRPGALGRVVRLIRKIQKNRQRVP